MHKVVIERPRWNPGPGKGRRRANLSDELQPKFEGIKRPHFCRKGLTDLLGPLKRWLRSQVGRPWNEVYSEACSVIKPDSVVRAHVKTHLLEFVERHTFMKNGEVFARWCNEEMPVVELRGRWRICYVHPETGVLMAMPPWKRKQRYKAEDTERVWITDTLVLRKLKGLWFECQVEAYRTGLKPGGNPWRWDYAEGKIINTQDLYGGLDYCVEKRQLSRSELKKHGLKNDTARSGAFVTFVSGLRTHRTGIFERAVDCGLSSRRQ